METGSPYPPSTVNNMVISSISEGAVLDFALSYLWLLWVHVQHTTTKHQTLNCKEFLSGTTP